MHDQVVTGVHPINVETAVMAYINKTSLRDEFAHLKAEFERLSVAGKVTPEIRILVNALLMLFEMMMAIFLEKMTPKTSKNSSKPSSQMDKPDTSAVGGTHTRGLAAEHRRFANSRTIETVEIAPVATCARCARQRRSDARGSIWCSKRWSPTSMPRSSPARTVRR